MDQSEANLASLLKNLKFECLVEGDRDIRKKYHAIMSPLAKYLDVLLSEVNSYLGCAIPLHPKDQISVDRSKAPRHK